ncbi:MAG: hypothetical protein H6835_00185 [Planctomycetes bacterium]|nr:hypothetical protein [Planctomycetota bacterium]
MATSRHSGTGGRALCGKNSSDGSTCGAARQAPMVRPAPRRIVSRSAARGPAARQRSKSSHATVSPAKSVVVAANGGKPASHVIAKATPSPSTGSGRRRSSAQRSSAQSTAGSQTKLPSRIQKNAFAAIGVDSSNSAAPSHAGSRPRRSSRNSPNAPSPPITRLDHATSHSRRAGSSLSRTSQSGG